MRLLIPAAKIIPLDLQNIGKIPAIIYPVNGGTAYDFFEEKYGNEVSEIDILCYEKAFEVRKKLQFRKPPAILRIVELDILGDLGRTVYTGLEDLTEKDEEIVINFADTIVTDPLPLQKNNFIAYIEHFPNELWTYFEISNGEITHVSDKKKITGRMKKPLFVGIFKIKSGFYFKECLEQAFTEKDLPMDTFYFALMLYSRKFRFDGFLVNDWLDIGHMKGYFESKLTVRSREFNHISIDKKRGILRKTSENKQKFIDEIQWYLKLPQNIEYVRPRIFSYSLDYENPYVEMEYYSYHTLHELFLYGDLTYEQWNDIFRHLLFLMEDFGHYKYRDTKLNAALKEIYLDKTIRRIQALQKKSNFQRLFYSPIIINDVAFQSLNDICKVLMQAVPDCLCDVDEFSIIHGDLCFANILIDNNFSFIKLIDPRGSFGECGIYGDRRYEIAKLLHSIDGKYDFIIKDLFTLEQRHETEFYFQITEPERDFEILEIFKQVFNPVIGNDWKKIELIESLLFLSMIPLHNESLMHQFAMLCTGILLLDKVIDIKI